MTEHDPGFLQRLVKAAANVGRRFHPDTPEGFKELQEFALELVQSPESDQTHAVLDQLSKPKAFTEQKILNPGFRPKMDVGFRIAEKDNYFRRGKSYPGKDEPAPQPGPEHS